MFNATYPFDPLNPKEEEYAKIRCYMMIGQYLANLPSAIHTIQYRIEIIHHTFNEKLRIVKITATIGGD